MWWQLEMTTIHCTGKQVKVFWYIYHFFNVGFRLHIFGHHIVGRLRILTMLSIFVREQCKTRYEAKYNKLISIHSLIPSTCAWINNIFCCCQTRLQLSDYEAENLARLQKMFSRKWEFIFMQAEAQAKVNSFLFDLANCIRSSLKLSGGKKER